MKYILFALSISLCLSLSAQSWTQVADLPTGRHHPVTFGIDGFGYAATGTNSNNLPTADFYRYDPAADSWTTLNDFPGSARSFAIGTVYKGKGYLGFGATQFAYLNDLWRYDPVADNWTQLASCPCDGRRHPSFVAVNDAIYVGLGDGIAGDLDDWWKYDIINDTWSQLPDLPGPGRHHPFQFTVNGQVYAGMGHAGQTIFGDWYQLDTQTDTWTAMNDFPGEARVAGTQINHAGKGYVLSGDGDNHSTMPTGEFWEYDAGSDSWTELTSHPGRSRWAPGSFIVNDELYVLGGLDRQASLLRREVYKIVMASTLSLPTTAIQNSTLATYPNPVKNYLNIEYKGKIDRIILMDVTGQTVLSSDAKPGLDLEHLPSGLYFLRIEENGGQIRAQSRIIKH